MKWTRLLRRHGYQVEESGVVYDPYATLAHRTPTDASPATLTYTVGTSREYGEIKCSVSLTISCPQNEKAIDLAAELAFRKGVELVNDGASHLGLPLLPVPEDA